MHKAHSASIQAKVHILISGHKHRVDLIVWQSVVY